MRWVQVCTVLVSLSLAASARAQSSARPPSTSSAGAPRAGAITPLGAPSVLRVCADPNNLPFSNEKREGFENRIAELVAREMHAELRYTWWAQRRGYIRNSLRAGLCDVFIGMPTGLDMVLTTRPYYRSTYAFVTKRSGPRVSSFDDPQLKRLRVGVQIIGDDFANAPPGQALSNRGIIRNVRGYTVLGDYRQPNPPSRIVRAVEKGGWTWPWCGDHSRAGSRGNLPCRSASSPCRPRWTCRISRSCSTSRWVCAATTRCCATRWTR